MKEITEIIFIKVGRKYKYNNVSSKAKKSVVLVVSSSSVAGRFDL